MKKLLLTAALILVSAPAFAQRVSQLHSMAPTMSAGNGIAAVVNENIITKTDLEQRMQLALLSSGLPDNTEVRLHLLPQILRGLIDEQLQGQEAKRLDISVSKDEINQAIEQIGRDNKIPGDFSQFLSAHGISPAAMAAQVKAGMLWSKVVARELRPKVEVGDDEIDAVIDRIRGDAGKEEYLVSEILLTVDNPKDEDQVQKTAQKLVEQIKQGASFTAVARQFSQGAGAAQGGDMGWIQQGQLAPELNKALASSIAGAVSDPIRTANGFHILGVRDKRTVSLGDPDKATINIAQAYRATSAATKDAAMKEAARVRAAVKSCADLDSGLSTFTGWKALKLGDMNLSKAPGWIVEKVRNVGTGNSTLPLQTDRGVAVLFVCSRNDTEGVDRDAIMRSIGTEKLELQARRLLRDLRRAAYVDIKIGRHSEAGLP